MKDLFKITLLVLSGLFITTTSVTAANKSNRVVSKKTAPGFAGCIRIRLREYDKTAKTYMIYGDQIVLFPSRLSRPKRKKLSALIGNSRILARTIPVGYEQPIGHYTEFFFDYASRSRWTARIPTNRLNSYKPLTTFLNQYGKHVHGLGPE